VTEFLPLDPTSALPSSAAWPSVARDLLVGRPVQNKLSAHFELRLSLRMFTTRQSVDYGKDECGGLNGTGKLDRQKETHPPPYSINVTMNDIAAILDHDHHAESRFTVRPTVLFTCFALLLDVLLLCP
jgi:hypothetical protein